jgi:hypothetical protein
MKKQKNNWQYIPFKKGQKVWLEATNLKMTHPTAKLAAKHYGPFTITEEISDVAFKLKIPQTWKIHDVFHATLLIPYTKMAIHGPNYVEPPPDIIEGEPEWEVEQILDTRIFGQTKKQQYCICWKGYSPAHNSWEPEENIHAPELFKAFQKKQKTTIGTIRIRELFTKTPYTVQKWKQQEEEEVSSKFQKLNISTECLPTEGRRSNPKDEEIP